MTNFLKKLICFMLLIGICACAGSANLNEKKLTAAEYFQKAYEATDKNDYALAIRYYQAFQQNYPDDVEHNLWADFEIAFTYYKMGRKEKALELFNSLINRYETAGNAQWTIAPKTLAERVKAKILEQKK